MNQSPHQARADQAAASLGLATNISQQLMPKAEQPVDAPATPETPPGQEQSQETKKDAEPKDTGMKDLELAITKKLDDIRQELKEDNQREIDTLKKTIEALK